MAVIGLGCVGLPLAVGFAEAGFRTTGIDVDRSKVAAVNGGESYIGDVVAAHVAALVAAVVAAATGLQALATVESRVVSLVVSGSHLRGLSGAEVLQKLRDREARHRLPPVPFIMLSGDLDLSAVARVCRLAMPVTVGDLVSTVSAMLHLQPAMQPLQ